MFKLFLNVVIVTFNPFLEVAYVNCIKRIYDDDDDGDHKLLHAKSRSLHIAYE